MLFARRRTDAGTAPQAPGPSQQKLGARVLPFEVVSLNATTTRWAACADAKTSPAHQRSPSDARLECQGTLSRDGSNGRFSYSSLFVTRGKAPEPGSLLRADFSVGELHGALIATRPFPPSLPLTDSPTRLSILHSHRLVTSGSSLIYV